jgi:hypothetical protein
MEAERDHRLNVPAGEEARLLRRCGFEVEDLIELQPSPGATTQHPLASRNRATVMVQQQGRREDGGKRLCAGSPGGLISSRI